MNKRNLMAGIFMGVAIAASIPLGINRSLSRVREDVSGTFYYDQAGYSIYDGLEKRGRPQITSSPWRDAIRTRTRSWRGL